MILRLLLASTVALAGCSSLGHRSYSAEPIEAVVVDAQTGQPLEGVIVVAHWELKYGTVGGRIPVGQLMILEAVTDRDGRFSFPGWGPITNPTEGHLGHEDPELLFYKNGYRTLGLENRYEVDWRTKPSRRTSEWNGKTLKMTRFSGSLADYERHLSSYSGIALGFLDDNCNWKRAPRTIHALGEKRREFRAAGIASDLYAPEILDYRMSDKKKQECGSAQNFFRGRFN